MPRLTKTRRRALSAALFAAAMSPAAHALEHITLRNGFAIDCVRHETLDATHIRLYLNGDNNYQDIAANEIARVETLPDPLPPPQPVAVAPTPAIAASAEPTPAEMHQLLVAAGAAHNIDEDLLASVIKAESGGHVKAVSRAGAQGLMQLMPATAHTLGVTDSFRADQNIAGGSAYLDSLLKRYKDNLALALAAYNAGPGAVDRYRGIPPFRETRAYVARVIREFNRRKQAASLAAVASITR
ncbi:MAG TPA: lytic transglycosylase domain-containing protein [Acidobacteriaceae bacterium]|nr:lytic transglycosylase domain-containing protein [Acidobacteriaceae bacterium]